MKHAREHQTNTIQCTQQRYEQRARMTHTTHSTHPHTTTTLRTIGLLQASSKHTANRTAPHGRTASHGRALHITRFDVASALAITTRERAKIRGQYEKKQRTKRCAAHDAQQRNYNHTHTKTVDMDSKHTNQELLGEAGRLETESDTKSDGDRRSRSRSDHDHRHRPPTATLTHLRTSASPHLPSPG